MDSLLHIAFVVEDMPAELQCLLDTGCTVQEAITPMPNGVTLAMLRDPWGLALQLVKRNQPMP